MPQLPLPLRKPSNLTKKKPKYRKRPSKRRKKEGRKWNGKRKSVPGRKEEQSSEVGVIWNRNPDLGETARVQGHLGAWTRTSTGTAGPVCPQEACPERPRVVPGPDRKTASDVPIMISWIASERGTEIGGAGT